MLTSSAGPLRQNRSTRGITLLELLIGSVQLSPIRIGETKALLLGPLAVEPAFRERGVGYALIERVLAQAKAKPTVIGW